MTKRLRIEWVKEIMTESRNLQWLQARQTWNTVHSRKSNLLQTCWRAVFWVRKIVCSRVNFIWKSLRRGNYTNWVYVSWLRVLRSGCLLYPAQQSLASKECRSPVSYPLPYGYRDSLLWRQLSPSTHLLGPFTSRLISRKWGAWACDYYKGVNMNGSEAPNASMEGKISEPQVT